MSLGTSEARESPPPLDAPRAGKTRRGRALGYLRGYPATGPGRVVVLVTVAALAIRLYTLSRPGYLTGITEYDDGVYLGAALRMTQGVVPYRDFAFIQPPGILLLMAPVALAAKVITTVKALALARVLTVLASTACVWLAGSLVRHRGSVVTLVTAGFLAVYPDDVSTAHTLLLEPWMNLLCLLAVTAAFRDGRLARPERLLWAGLAMGFAMTVKLWAVIPAAVLLAVCLLALRDLAPRDIGDEEAQGSRKRRVRRYVAGLVIGAGVPLAPFALAAPAALWSSAVTGQATRVGNTVAIPERLAHLTGLIDVLNTSWRLAPGATGTHSIFADANSAPLHATTSVAALAYPATAVALLLIIAGYWWRARAMRPRPPQWLSPLEWFSVVTAAGAGAAVLVSPTFFYHYPDFAAPWLALTVGGAAAALQPAAVLPGAIPQPGASVARRPGKAVAAVALVLALVAVVQLREMAPMRQATAQSAAHGIPAGACVVTDESSLLVAADRFAGHPSGCPVIVDSLAQSIVLSDGVNWQPGAPGAGQVAAAWESLLSRADYVWLSPKRDYTSRIPWTPSLNAWFSEHFRPLGSYSSHTGQVYERIAR